MVWKNSNLRLACVFPLLYLFTLPNETCGEKPYEKIRLGEFLLFGISIYLV